MTKQRFAVALKAIFILAPFLFLLSLEPCEASSARVTPFEAMAARTLPFQPLAQPSNATSESPCQIASPALRLIARKTISNITGLPYDVAKKRDASLVGMLSTDLCRATYLYLGGDQYLLKFRGLGLFNLKTNRWSALSTGYASFQQFSPPVILNANSLARIYSYYQAGNGQDHEGYWLLVFRRQPGGTIGISAGEFADTDAGTDSGRPLCPYDDPNPRSAEWWETSISDISLTKASSPGQAEITFNFWRKNCKTGEVHHATKELIYDDGDGLIEGHKKIDVAPMIANQK